MRCTRRIEIFALRTVPTSFCPGVPLCVLSGMQESLPIVTLDCAT